MIFNENNIQETNLNLKKIKELKQGFIYNPTFFEDDISSFQDLNKYPLIFQKKESNSYENKSISQTFASKTFIKYVIVR